MSSLYQSACIRCGQPCYGFYYNSCICPRCGMILFNGSCDNRIYGNEKPVTYNECEGVLRGGYCFPCNFKAENSLICDQNAYSFNDNSNYLPQPQYENYLCNLCENNSHDGYDCQQQFLFVYEQEPSYNQNYDDNYYPYDLPSFLVVITIGDLMKLFHAKGDLIKSIQTFLEEFNCIPFKEKTTILLQAWFRFFAIKHDQHKNSNKLFQKLFEDLKELAEYKESPENSYKEIDTSNSNEEKEGPQQDYDIHKLIREECSVEVFAPILSTKEPEYSSSMGYENPNTTSETESDEIIKSSVEELIPILSKNEVISEDKREFYDDFEDIEYVEASLSDPEIVSVEEENVVQHEEEEEEVDLEDIFQIQDVDLREKLLSITRLIANIESLNDNPTPDCVLNSSVLIPIFEESDNSLSDNFSLEFEFFCDHTKETRSGNTTHADNSLPKYDSFRFEIEPNQERLINVLKNNIFDDSSDPLLEEANLFLASDNSIPPGNENSTDDSKRDICFLEELLIDDSILSHESSDFNFEDNPSVPLPPSKPPDAEFNFKPDSEEEILGVINDKDEDVDYSFFIFVIFAKVFSFLFAKSEDTIFEPGISV
uniref:Pre-mRNA splicing Prp18-interacting factor n=1 Tax=Tanacetum cinerariifolium TaxID=118510 RepID=A0A6L2JQ82_TANCI|nr:hypothetical protein [Tanacetum cinerariifolium]